MAAARGVLLPLLGLGDCTWSGFGLGLGLGFGLGFGFRFGFGFGFGFGLGVGLAIAPSGPKTVCVLPEPVWP